MCLLYLLSETVKKFGSDIHLPATIYSIHVNHDLQPANADMAQKVSSLVANLGVKDIQYKVPWGSPPYPPRPLRGQAFEEMARDARSHILMMAMLETNVFDIAYGHHLDDQVETVLMRLSRGSGPLGASGMKRLRRWGMGSESQHDLRYAGEVGLRRNILRPFLDISKVRWELFIDSSVSFVIAG